MAEIAGLREVVSAQASFDVTPKKRRPLPCRRAGAGADRPDLRGDAGADRERDRRADRPDLRAARADSRKWPTWSMRPTRAARRFRIRRSRSSTASSISAGSRPMRCISRIDPYPRKPDAVFEPPVVAADPEDHPFAALKALKAEAKRRQPEEARSARREVRAGSGSVNLHGTASGRRCLINPANALNYITYSDVAAFCARQNSGIAKRQRSRGCVGTGTRYCRGPAGAQRCTSPIAADPWRFPVRGRAL